MGTTFHPILRPKKSVLQPNHFRVYFSKWFLLSSVTISAGIAFVLGCGTRFVFWPRFGTLQRDILRPKYTSKVFTESDAIQTVLVDQSKCSTNGDDKEDLEPAGYQLLVDIKHVDASFLNSKHQLLNAMTTLLNESEKTLLSYHCHSLIPMGVSCVGLSIDSHTSIYTWPMDGVISLELYTSGEEHLDELVQGIEDLFAVRQMKGDDEKAEFPEPAILWAHKLRGFREGFSPDYHLEDNPLDGEMSQDMLMKRNFDLKKQVVSFETKFQQVDIYELINAYKRSLTSYEKSMSNDGSYEAHHSELFRPERVVYLDGVLQSSLYGETAYHEALVHPAMIAHPNPRRVAIIGGGEGATLREVLKHKTVEEVAMIDIDGEFVNLCREYLPEWSDCSDLVESAVDSCFDDERASVYFEDAFSWFIDRFGDHDRDSAKKEELFDVVIMDALDPNDAFVEKLYKNSLFLHSLYDSLNDHGVLVSQIGRSQYAGDVIDETGVLKYAFKELGFKSMHVYEDGHSLFYMPWSYLIAFKDTMLRKNWYRNAAEIDLQLQQRIDKTHSNKPALLHFDTSTMVSYQVPHKAFENVHCRQENTSSECNELLGSEPKFVNESMQIVQKNPYSPVVERHMQRRQVAMNSTSSGIQEGQEFVANYRRLLGVGALK